MRPATFLRGTFVWVLESVQRAGIPLDPVLDDVVRGWPTIRVAALRGADTYGLLDDNLRLKHDRFERLVYALGIRGWPRTAKSKRLRTDVDTIERMAKDTTEVHAVKDLLTARASTRLTGLEHDDDFRQRPPPRPLVAVTGRSQPRASARGERQPDGSTRIREHGHIFLGPRWARHFIQPPPGRCLVYADQSGQEFAVMAALSGDKGLEGCYRRGDPYTAMARMLHLVPPGASPGELAGIRAQMKVVALATAFGQGAAGLAPRIRKPKAEAIQLLQAHRDSFPRFWAWSDGVVNRARRDRYLQTAAGWRLHRADERSERQLRNWLVQATGADLMRVITVALVDAGVQVDAIVHDGFLCEGPAARIEDLCATIDGVMRGASRAVLGGFEIRNDLKVVGPGQHFLEPRGAQFWQQVMKAIGLDPAPGYGQEGLPGPDTGRVGLDTYGRTRSSGLDTPVSIGLDTS
jgi:DNA polymerase family A